LHNCGDRSFFENRHTNNAYIPRLAFATRVGIAHGRKSKCGHRFGRDAKSVNRDRATRGYDVASLAGKIGRLTVDHVETIYRHNGLNAPPSWVIHPNRVTLARLAVHVEALVMRVGVEGETIFSH